MLKKHKAILAGGTALALRMGRRISADLDFFTEEDFDVESIISDVRRTKLQFQVISEGEKYLIAEVGGIKFLFSNTNIHSWKSRFCMRESPSEDFLI